MIFTVCGWCSQLQYSSLPCEVGSLALEDMKKNPPTDAGDMRDASLIPGSGRSPEEEVATHSSILAWRIPWTDEPGGLQSMGSQKTRTRLRRLTLISPLRSLTRLQALRPQEGSGMRQPLVSSCCCPRVRQYHAPVSHAGHWTHSLTPRLPQLILLFLFCFSSFIYFFTSHS